MTLKRAKSALGVRSEKEADGPWTWRLPKGIKGIIRNRTSQDDPLDPLEPLPVTEAPPEKQEDQGDQEAPQSDDDRLYARGNGLKPGKRCIHDVPVGCWLCKKYARGNDG